MQLGYYSCIVEPTCFHSTFLSARHESSGASRRASALYLAKVREYQRQSRAGIITHGKLENRRKSFRGSSCAAPDNLGWKP